MGQLRKFVDELGGSRMYEVTCHLHCKSHKTVWKNCDVHVGEKHKIQMKKTKKRHGRSHFLVVGEGSVIGTLCKAFIDGFNSPLRNLRDLHLHTSQTEFSFKRK